MKRIILALTMAGISLAAFAVPPGPPATPTVDVNVVNQPVAVSVTLGVTPKNDVFIWGESGFDQMVLGDHQFEFPVLLTGVAVQLQMAPSVSPTDKCDLWIGHHWIDPDGTRRGLQLVSMSVLANTGPVATYVPLPNIRALVGDLLVLSATTPTIEGGGKCLVNAFVYGVKAH
jgi:hypothetical protein